MSDSPEDYELFHFGVKGMKWGVVKSVKGKLAERDAKILDAREKQQKLDEELASGFAKMKDTRRQGRQEVKDIKATKANGVSRKEIREKVKASKKARNAKIKELANKNFELDNEFFASEAAKYSDKLTTGEHVKRALWTAGLGAVKIAMDKDGITNGRQTVNTILGAANGYKRHKQGMQNAANTKRNSFADSRGLPRPNTLNMIYDATSGVWKM